MADLRKFWLEPIKTLPKWPRKSFAIAPLGAMWLPVFSLVALLVEGFSKDSLVFLLLVFGGAYIWGLLGLIGVGYPVFRILEKIQPKFNYHTGLGFILFGMILAPLMLQMIAFLGELIPTGDYESFSFGVWLTIFAGPFSGALYSDGGFELFGLIHSVLAGSTVAALVWILLRKQAVKEGLA